MSLLNKTVCRIVGHDWDTQECLRCGRPLDIQVFQNGVLMQPNYDYALVNEEISFVEAPLEGSRISIFVRHPNKSSVTNITTSGGTATFTVTSIGE